MSSRFRIGSIGLAGIKQTRATRPDHRRKELQAPCASSGRIARPHRRQRITPSDAIARPLNQGNRKLEAKNHTLPDATPAAVFAYLMEEQNLKQTDLVEELGGQSIVSAILNGKRELNTRQVKALATRFKISPAVFL